MSQGGFKIFTHPYQNQPCHKKQSTIRFATGWNEKNNKRSRFGVIHRSSKSRDKGSKLNMNIATRTTQSNEATMTYCIDSICAFHQEDAAIHRFRINSWQADITHYSVDQLLMLDYLILHEPSILKEPKINQCNQGHMRGRYGMAQTPSHSGVSYIFNGQTNRVLTCEIKNTH